MLEIADLCARYGTHTALHSVSFAVPDHQITVVIGRNGCGKSTLVSCINQTVKYTGNILLHGNDLATLSPRERAQKMAILPQILPSPALSVRELVLMGRSPYQTVVGRNTDEDGLLAEHAMEQVGIRHLQNKRADQISGGERQLVYLAMLLAQNTDFLILDEPTSFMDIANEERFLSLLSTLCHNCGKSILLVIHNLSMAVRIAEQIVILEQGNCVFQGSRSVCLQKEAIERYFSVRRHTVQEDGKEFLFFSSSDQATTPIVAGKP